MDTIMGRKTKFLSIIIIPGFFYLLTSIVAVPVLENGSLNSEWRVGNFLLKTDALLFNAIYISLGK